MIEKGMYCRMKKEIRLKSKKNILELIDEMMLNDIEKALLLDFYESKNRIETCMTLCMSTTTYTKELKNLFSKIKNYQDTH